MAFFGVLWASFSSQAKCNGSQGRTGRRLLGWHSFDQSLLTAREADLVSDDTILTYCTNKGKIRQALDQLHKRLGLPQDTAVSGLKLDIVAPIKMAPPSATTRAGSDA